jgi:CBS domain-containing protein
MSTISEIMSTDVQVIEPEDTLRRAARMMQDLDVGALPVCTGKQLLGMVTDRDITVRGVACGLTPDDACVSDVMSKDARWCSEDQDTDEVMQIMGEAQLRRMPVMNADNELVGIVSLADLALRQSAHIDSTVRQISEPDGIGSWLR